MGDNGSPPLSRRVPGTTSMPQARVRRSPPRLSDDLLARLKAEVRAARSKEAQEQEAKDLWESDEGSVPEPPREALPKRSNLTAFPKRARTERLPTWPKVEPLPREAKVAPPPARPQAPPLPQRPKVTPRIERPKLAPLRQEPEVAPRADSPKDPPLPERPRVAPLRPRKTEDPPEPEQAEWHVVHDSPQWPAAESDETTEPIPVVAPSRPMGTAKPIRELLTDQAPSAAPERPPRQVRRSPPRPKIAAPRLPKPSAPRLPKLAAPRLPRRAAPNPAASNQVTMLQALFAETADFEEVVASARAQAGRSLAGVEWRYIIAAAGLAAMILVAVVVFMLQLVG
jgi:hypothetical protein